MADGPRMVQVQVTHVIDPHNFHAQIGTEEFFKSLSDQDAQLDAWGEEKSADPLNLGVTDDKDPGDWIIAYSATWEKWVRGQINLVDIENGEVDINCVDYGTTEILPLEKVISDVDEAFTQWQPNAYPCTLAGVTPIAKNWITRASRFFEDLVQDETLTGQVLGYDDQNQVMLDLLVEDDGEIISASDLLFKEGLARLVSVRPESEAGKVPNFDVNQLCPKLPPPVPHVQREPTPPTEDVEDIEKDIFRTLIGAEKHSTKWIPSDQTIGENYQANVDDSTVLTLQEELRQMSESTEAPVSILNDSWTRNRDRSKDRQWGARGRAGGRGGGLHQWATDKEPGLGQDRQKKSPPRHGVVSTPTENGSAMDSDIYSKRHLEPTFKKPAPVKDNTFDRLHTSRSDDKQWRGRSQGNQEHTESRINKKSDWWDIPGRGRGDGNLSNDSLSDGGHSNENKSITNSPTRGKQTDARRRYGPAAVKNSGFMQNEYDWQSSKVQRKGKAILKTLREDSLREVIAEFSQLVYPEASTLVTLPGPKELHICIELMFSFVADHPEHTNLIIALLEHFKGDKSFVTALNDCLQGSLKEYVVATTNVVLKRQRKAFLQFLGHLYLACQTWQSPAGEPVIHSVTTSFDTWCGFNIMKQHSSPAHTHEVYLQSLSTLLCIVGPTLTQRWPAKVQEGFDQLKLKAIDVDLEQSLRLQILDILVQQVAGWPNADSTDCKTRDNARQPQHEKNTQVYPWELAGCVDCGTMTELSGHTPGVLPSRGHDLYRQVTHMLEQLNMSCLLDTFKDNAIRDSLLDMQFSDLRELLREVGVKAGYIWEIKSYLETHKLHIPQSPVCVSSPSPQSSSCGDLTDPEVAHFTDDTCPPPQSHLRNVTAAATLGPVFIPPHRFQLLTPSNFTSGNISTSAHFDPGAAEVSPATALGNSLTLEERSYLPIFNNNNDNGHQSGVNSQGQTQRQMTSRADGDTNWRTRHQP